MRTAVIAAMLGVGLAAPAGAFAQGFAQLSAQPSAQAPPAQTSAAVGDRYGPVAARFAVASRPAPVSPPAAPLRRVLMWEGKSGPASVHAPVPAVAVTPPRPLRTPAFPSAALVAPNVSPVIVTAAPFRPPAVLVAALGAAPGAAPVAALGGTARYYSLHRAYGMTPDPAPIPPAFFGPTADLSTPETGEAAPRASATTQAGASRSAVNAARLAGEAAQ